MLNLNEQLGVHKFNHQKLINLTDIWLENKNNQDPEMFEIFKVIREVLSGELDKANLVNTEHLPESDRKKRIEALGEFKKFISAEEERYDPETVKFLKKATEAVSLNIKKEDPEIKAMFKQLIPFKFEKSLN